MVRRTIKQVLFMETRGSERHCRAPGLLPNKKI